ncbi:MAG: chemotaxis protein CheW [Acidimicrobiia bacterium]
MQPAGQRSVLPRPACHPGPNGGIPAPSARLISRTPGIFRSIEGFGLAVDQVEGIASRSEIQSLPIVRNGLLGTIRYREALVAVFDAAAVLGTAPLERDDAQPGAAHLGNLASGAGRRRRPDHGGRHRHRGLWRPARERPRGPPAVKP